jgi:hypothetical protein
VPRLLPLQQTAISRSSAVQRIQANLPGGAPPVFRPYATESRAQWPGAQPARMKAPPVYRPAQAPVALRKPAAYRGPAPVVPAPPVYRPSPPIIHRMLAGMVVQRICSHPGCTDPLCTSSLNHYSQKMDPSLDGFISKGDTLVGEKALKKQRVGSEPTADDVRVSARRSPYQRSGAGLNEGVPTNYRGTVARSKDRTWRGLQSGMRSATDLTPMFDPKTGETAAHTGMFPKSTGRGSTNTKGQASAHDTLRTQPTGSTSQDKVSDGMFTFLSSFSSGPQIMSSTNLTGGIPNIVGSSAVGPVSSSGTPDPIRFGLADASHERRELAKNRTRSFHYKYGTARPPSPEREPLQPDGSGGGYLGIGPSRRPSSPVPVFDGLGNEEEEAAQSSAWMSAPFRHNYSSRYNSKKCLLGHTNPETAKVCMECHQPL